MSKSMQEIIGITDYCMQFSPGIGRKLNNNRNLNSDFSIGETCSRIAAFQASVSPE